MGCLCECDISVVGRTEPNLDDVALAFNELHITLSELRDYVENVDSKPFAHDVVEFPAAKSSRLQPVEQEQVTGSTDLKDGLVPTGSQTDLEGSSSSSSSSSSSTYWLTDRP